ncbi:Carrier domain-containing protein [Frankia sp. AiPs1]|uniref:non-ribosomal peptide synthetase n=1 Tax=Frankia sp. AiPa1 TaxID=573492 RepID=UPI00202ACFEE|nr:non-ribosomal peptide synthetase [Frankia sp. AiPa1]MCL9758108.1 amino acid adenylation domain-containing protein [Frankia sp. AiPa1]
MTSADQAVTRTAARPLLEPALHGVDRSRRPAVAPPVERGLPLPVSFAQERLWLLEQLRPGSTEYLVPLALRLAGKLESETLWRALHAVVDRHEVLRTRYIVVDDTPLQCIDPQGAYEPQEIDLRALAEPERAARTTEIITSEGTRPFNLQAEQPMRAVLIRLSDTEALLLLAIHHIAVDGWSAELLQDELAAFYTAFHEGGVDPLPPLSRQYADFAQEQRAYAATAEAERELTYWRGQLAGVRPLPLLTDRSRGIRWESAGSTAPFTVAAQTISGLAELGRSRGCTMYMVLLAAVQAFLARVTGQPDVVVGSPIAGRDDGTNAKLIGYFANTLALRASADAELPFHRFLEQVRDVALDAYANAAVPFERLVSDLRTTRDLSRNPVFQASLTFEPEPPGTRGLPGATMVEERVEWTPAKFDLAFLVRRTTTGTYLGHIEYPTALFDAETVERMARQFTTLLQAVCRAPETPIGALPLGEPAPLPVHPSTRPNPTLIHLLVEHWARTTPQMPALTAEGADLTYAELDRQANRLAHHLRSLGVVADQPVGVHLRRGTALVVTLLAVLKAGGAYLPLDPDQPPSRLADIVADSAARVVVTDDADALERIAAEHIVVLGSADLTAALAEQSEDAPAWQAHPDQLAYVIYTSGSTGRPKGVMVTHANATRLFTTTAAEFGFGPNDVWTLFHSYAFDFSVWEIWGALCHGGRLVIVPFEVSRDPLRFVALLAGEHVTVVNQTPSAFGNLVAAFAGGNAPDLDVRVVVFGGESLDSKVLRPWFDRYGGQARVVNMYGITETTVHVTRHEVTASDAAGAPTAGRSPIGAALADLELYVLDTQMQPVPPGIPGELYVGGRGLARGYLGQPALTGERFVPDPYSGRPGDRLYRTGDQARVTPGRGVEYLRRIDGQVKVRGFRIETGEVESALATHRAIAACVVAVHGDRLAAWVVPAPGHDVDPHDLRAHLARQLPAYMLPSAFVALLALPLTTNGKADRAALPAPEPDQHAAGRGSRPARTPRERAVTRAWAEVLGIPEPGVEDNFFHLGGDSIRAVQVVGRLRAGGYELGVAELLRFQTPRALAAVLPDTVDPLGDHQATRPFSLIDDTTRAALVDGVQDAYPLTEGQAGMVYEVFADPTHPYHNATCYLVRDDAALDLDALRAAVRQVTTRHEVLRTSIDLATFAEPLQLVHARADITLRHVDLRTTELAKREEVIADLLAAERRELFDLNTPGLWRLAVYQEQDDRWRLAFVEFHAILDGWSHHSLITELIEAYRALRSGSLAALDVPSVRFADFVALERTESSPDHLEFWRRRLDGVEPLVLPAAWQAGTGAEEDRAGDGTGEGTTYDVHVPFSHLEPALRALARAADVSFKSVLLTAHLKVLSMLTDQQGFHTGLVTNGRLEELEADRTLGMHLNVVPVVCPRFTGTWRDAVREVFDQETEIWKHRRYPMARLCRELGVPAPRAAFNFLDFHILDRDRVDVSATVDVSPNEFDWAVSTEWGRLVLVANAQMITRPHGLMLARLYGTVLSAMAEEPSASAAGSALPAPDREALVRLAGDADAATPRTFHELVADWAHRSPDADAVCHEETRLTYAELMCQVDALAGRLRASGVGRGTVAGVLLPQGPDLVIAQLAVLRAGGAYLPISPDQPAERRAYLLADAQASHLITREPGPETTAGFTGSVLSVSPHAYRPAPVRGGGARYLPAPELPEVLPGDSAYVIYTSGSTGRPKGVVVEHRGLATLVAAQARHLDISPGSRVLQNAAPIFDISVFETLLALAHGATLVTAPPDRLVPGEELAGLVREQRVTHLVMVPSALALMPTDRRPRVVIVGGEECPPALAARWSRGGVLINGYGPTETTVWATVERSHGQEQLTIGRPIEGARAHVLGPDMEPRPVGVPGELYLSGPGVARGYLGQPARTAEQFLPDPFSTAPGTRLYRTGDRAYRLLDGRIGFLGRVDDQIKIRGHRIEPGEIEAAMHRHPTVAQAAVTPYQGPDGDTGLAGYFSVRTGHDLTPQTLAGFLGRELPRYMVPTALVAMPVLPTSATGKVDRRALPPVEATAGLTARRVVPRNATEHLVAGVWEELLRVRGVGAYDDFFALGGHSLLAIRAAAALERLTGTPVTVRDVLARPSVAATAAWLDGSDTGSGQNTDTCLVWFRRGGTASPILLVHPGGGGVHWYRALADLLPADHPVAALQHPAVTDPEQAGLDIGALAARYLRDVDAIGPAGPYRLLGWCGGSPVTWELARLLRARGDHVRLALLDPATVSDGEREPAALRPLRRLVTLLDDLAAAPDDREAARLREAAFPLLRDAIDDDGGIEVTAETVGPHWRERVRTWLRLHEASVAYQYPPAGDTDVHLLLSDELVGGAHEATDGLALDEYTARWQRLTPRLARHRLAGDHFGVLTPPRVGQLADRLAEIWTSDGIGR